MSNQTNETLARGPKDGTVAGGADGLLGVFRTLADQHDAVAAMFAKLAETPEARAMLWPELRRELVSHEHSEVRELFPVLRQVEELRALADHHDDEARGLDAMIRRLDTLDVQSDEWAEQFQELVRTVTYHAKEEEEKKIFPLAQRALGEPRALELDAKVALARQQILEGN
jgi:hemerythrin superfamily protein